MSTSHILLLIDEEISRLEQARAILAEFAAPKKRQTRRRSTNVVTVALAPVTVVAPRQPPQRRIRVSKPKVKQTTALSSPVPNGAVAVSAIEAARGRVRPVVAVPQPETPRWRPSGSLQRLTIDDLFRDSIELDDASIKSEPAHKRTQ